mgnify:CR=1 FL=1
MNIILIALLVLGITGLLAAVLLYVVAQKFKVDEDPRIDEVQAVLPGANCGGCGFAGCRNMAEACCKATGLEGLNCPVGGSAVMAQVSQILGLEAVVSAPKVAVVRCNGTCEARPRTSVYDGVRSCTIKHALYVGETNCPFGCLGDGDCEAACQFGAIHVNPETGLPEVDEDKCTSCGKCVAACPRHIIELRNKGPKNRRMVVTCVNKDKGAVAHKACKNACIGCGKCQNICPFDAVHVVDNVAYIDYEKCRLCRKCEAECPTGAIHAVNFPPRKPVESEKLKVESEKKAPNVEAPKVEESKKEEATV